MERLRQSPCSDSNYFPRCVIGHLFLLWSQYRRPRGRRVPGGPQWYHLGVRPDGEWKISPDLGEGARTLPPTHEFGKPNGVQSYSHNQTDPGMIPRALSRVFEYVGSEPMSTSTEGSAENISVKLSLLQIYNENVQVGDLPTNRPCVGRDSSVLYLPLLRV